MKKITNEENKAVNTKSIKYLAITIIFIMLPFIVKLIAFLFTDLKVSLVDDFVKGDFFMYAISLLAPIWYTIETVFIAGSKQERNAPVAETFITIVISMAAYVVFFICNCVEVAIAKVPVIILSILLMIWSTYLAYKIHMDEISFTPPDSKRTMDEDELKNNIEKIENGKQSVAKRKGIEGELDMSDWSEEDE